VTAPQAPLARPRSPATGELRGRVDAALFGSRRSSGYLRMAVGPDRLAFRSVQNIGCGPAQQLPTTAPCATGALAPHALRSGSNRVGIRPCIGHGFNFKDSNAKAFDRRARGERGFVRYGQGQLPNVSLVQRALGDRDIDQVQSGYSNSRGHGFASQHTPRRQAGQHRSAIAGRSRRRAFAGRQPLSRSLRCMCKPRLPPTHELLPGAPAIQIESRVRSVTRPGRVPKILALLLVWRFEAPMWADGVGIPASRGLENPGHADDFREDSHEVPSTS